jgi:hypothetical protein
VFFTLFLRSFILLRELECVVGASVVGGGAKSDQRCARGFAVLQYTRKHGLVRERRVCVTSSAAYGCALAHSPQTTREVRATFYSRLSQYGPHAAPCTFGREGPCPHGPGGGPPALHARFPSVPTVGTPLRVGAISPAIYPCPTLGFDPAWDSIYDKSHDR